ncbi:DNA-binding domain-containing protein, AraC-type [Leptolyngbya sp. PCC 7375]|nr:DNA-binding domain-containing protein, AraC-type [Leptolyngbya sp. PCC 7375]
MDILSEVLRTVRFFGSLDLRPEFSAPWLVTADPGNAFADSLQLGNKHIVPFHIVAEGHCWVKTNQGICQDLSPGDIIIFPHGDSHILGNQLEGTPTPITELLPAPPWEPPPLLKHGGGGDLTRLVCGFLQCEDFLSHPFLKTLPAFMHVRAFAEPTIPLLETGVRHIIQEANCSQPGSLCLLNRLVELMFVEILRGHMQSLSSQEQATGLAALNDPMIGQVLEWFHAEPARNWTVPELAKRVGMSRSALAQRFSELLGQPPMQYLTQWRLQLASRQLQTTNDGIAKIATQVGYESEAAFNRAFKRYVGVPPGAWRSRKLME